MKNSSNWTFTCKECECSFPKKILLILHKKHEHPQPQQEEEEEEERNNQTNLEKIKEQNLNSKKTQRDKDRHEIPLFEMEAFDFTSCSSETSEGSSDQESKISACSEPKAEPSANFLDHVTTRLSRGKKKVSYSCNFCGQDLQTMIQVKQHIPQHIGDSHFPCDRPTCPKSFSSLYDQLRHQERHLAKERKKRARAATTSTRPLNLIRDPHGEVGLIPSNGSIKGDSDPRDFYLGPRYCLCNNFSYGDMVACDRKGCPLEWFHFPCVGLKSKPRGTWHCPPCQARYKRKRMTSRLSTRTNLASAEAES